MRWLEVGQLLSELPVLPNHVDVGVASSTSIRSGLEECVALLAPQEPGSTLVLSSSRSDSVKGFVTRVGSRIVRGVCHPSLGDLALTE